MAKPQRKITIDSNLTGEFLKPEFLRKARKELEKNGFITDEHDFAPYREAIAEHWAQIERELRKIGFGGHLKPGRLDNHPGAGYAYYVFDSNRFSSNEAEAAVSRWLDRKYQDESHA
jgi:hypothetical protein